MPVPIQQCDLQLLHQLVENQLDAEHSARVEAHLSRCESCQKSIKALAGSTHFWRTTESRLAPEHSLELDTASPLHPPLEDLSRTADSDQAPGSSSSTAAMRYVAQLLGPTDDPKSMGRLGGYEVLGLIGIGGMGIVLKALDPSLNRFVAIKILSPHMAMHGSARQRFSREAKAAAAITHENVLAIHSIESWQDTPFLVMPYVNGQSLEKRLHQEGSLDINAILRIAFQIASGLAEAHAQGLVHRDIKPANILLSQGSERLKISDFGLARAADDASITRSGTITGTPTYMSPEQARGDSLDQRSDIFSFGTLLYQLCTGHAPFRAETPFGIIQRICDHIPRPIHDTRPNVPIWLCGIIETMLEKKAADRVQSTFELAALFRTGLNFLQEPDGAPIPQALADFVRTKNKQLARPYFFGSAIVATVTLTSFFILAKFLFLKNDESMAAIREASNEFSASVSMASLYPIASHGKDDLDTAPKLRANANSNPERLNYHLSIGEVAEYRITIKLARSDGAINVYGTLCFEVVEAGEASFELKYWIDWQYERSDSAFPANPFRMSDIEGEIAQLRRCEKQGRIKISQSGEVLGRSQESELPGQIGPMADLIFPTVEFTNRQFYTSTTQLLLHSVPASAMAGPPREIDCVDCSRIASFSLVHRENEDQSLILDSVFEDRLNLEKPVAATTTARYVFDPKSGWLSEVTLARQVDSESADHFADLTMKLYLVDETPTIQDK